MNAQHQNFRNAAKEVFKGEFIVVNAHVKNEDFTYRWKPFEVRVSLLEGCWRLSHQGSLFCACSVTQSLSRVQLFVTLWTAVCQAPLSMGILQVRILEWVAISFSNIPK